MTITLFLGGARSGKSRLAEAAAEAGGDPLIYLATGEAGDDEMAARIARHRADRGPRWRTVECPLDLTAAVAGVRDGAVLIDCLTLWLANLMFASRDADAEGAALVAALAMSPARLFMVSNEVGLGIVPETALGREFRDAQGRLNQRIAAAADEVYFVAAGLSLRMKPGG